MPVYINVEIADSENEVVTYEVHNDGKLISRGVVDATTFGATLHNNMIMTLAVTRKGESQ